MKVLRTIETFLPYVCGPANQAFQISDRLEGLGIHSPVLTTYCDVDPALPAEETIGRTRILRVRGRLQVMRYHVSPGMIRHLDDFDILHAHNYRNFQTDCGFFLPR
ncbi:MAG: hypothetical protein ACE5G9_00085 [Nitrospinales bacterium]